MQRIVCDAADGGWRALSGCHRMRGCLVSPPVPAESFTALLEASVATV